MYAMYAMYAMRAKAAAAHLISTDIDAASAVIWPSLAVMGRC